MSAGSGFGSAGAPDGQRGHAETRLFRASNSEPAPERGFLVVPPLRALSGSHNERAAEKALDTRASVSQLIESGRMRLAQPGAAEGQHTRDRAGRTPDSGDQVREMERRLQPADKLKVQYADRSNDPAKRVSDPDFIVKKDGSIEVARDPERHNGREIVIEVERNQGEVGLLPAAQQESVDRLVEYVSGRLMCRQPDGSVNGTIEDSQGLVSDALESRLRARPMPEASLPEPARRQVENMRRFSGGGRGTLSPDQADSYFTPRSEVPPRRPDESDSLVSLKETVGGMLSHGEARPYESARHNRERGWCVGRYSLSYDMIMDWLFDTIGDPPDPEKIEQAVRKGKISRQMAQKLTSPKFREFMQSLKGSEKPSGQAINEFLPRELQETIGGNLISRFAGQLKDERGQVDAGKVALAMSLGRLPTAGDLAAPENRAFVDAAQRLGTISDARTLSPGQPLEWQEVNERLLVAAKQAVGKAMWSQGPWSHSSLEYGNLGCAASVSMVMKYAGLDTPISAGSRLLEEKIIKKGGYRVDTPQPGDIVFGRRGPGKHGHVGIVGEDGKVYHNSSAKRHWVEADLNKVFSSKRGFVDVHFVRLPQGA